MKKGLILVFVFRFPRLVGEFTAEVTCPGVCICTLCIICTVCSVCLCLYRAKKESHVHVALDTTLAAFCVHVRRGCHFCGALSTFSSSFFFFHIHSVDLVRSCLLRYGHGNFSSGLLLRHAQCALIDPNHSNYIRLFFPPIFCFSREPFAKTTKCPSRRARKVRLPKAPIQMARQQQRTWGQRRRG